MLMCIFAWVIISVLGAIPFMIELNKSFTDAFFESVSGFTTTGITVFTGLDTMPHSIIFWRSLIQWLGGLGILTFFLFITANSESDLWQLFSAEGHKISSSRPVPNVYTTIKIFWLIYGLYTVLETIILKLLGLSLFEALIHSLTSLSTGGFSNHDASIAYYQQAGFANYRAIEYTITFFMLLGGINFLIHYRMLRKDPMAPFKDTETKGYLGIIGIITFLTVLVAALIPQEVVYPLEEGFRKTIFQVVSLITTTGFGTEDISSMYFPSLTKQLFILLMIIGGCVGSTSGGIKVIRAIILTKLFRREIKKINYPPNAVIPTTVENNVIDSEEILRISALVFGWLGLIVIGAGITAVFSDLGPFEAFSGMASAVGNIGPFYFSVDKMASLSPIIKHTYIIGMLAGRLELIPIFILFSKNTWK